MFQDGEFDIILLDIRMPVMNGIDTFKKIRTMDTDISILAVSANAYQEQIDEYKAIGFTDVITKPIDMDKLKEKLETL